MNVLRDGSSSDQTDLSEFVKEIPGQKDHSTC